MSVDRRSGFSLDDCDSLLFYQMPKSVEATRCLRTTVDSSAGSEPSYSPHRGARHTSRSLHRRIETRQISTVGRILGPEDGDVAKKNFQRDDETPLDPRSTGSGEKTFLAPPPRFVSSCSNSAVNNHSPTAPHGSTLDVKK